MERIPPSQRIAKQISKLLDQGLVGEEDVRTLMIRPGVERLVQEMSKQEATDELEREHYKRRRPEQEHRAFVDEGNQTVQQQPSGFNSLRMAHGAPAVPNTM
jgi:uncharacterized membrane protein YheB (UPF0754 family)